MMESFSVTMIVSVHINLTSEGQPIHCRQMHDAAFSLTDNPQSIRVTIGEDKVSMLAEFTMSKSRQMDVVDKIGHEFMWRVQDSDTYSIWFPKTPRHSKSKRKSPASKFTDKQGQYLAFIHSYTVIHSRSPSERDMQDFFGTTPPTIHQMILKLEAHGWIARVPEQARSIKMLLPPEELPVLMPRQMG